MKNKKLFILGMCFLSSLSTLTSLVSCGEQSDNDPYTITFSHTFGGANRTAMESAIADFTKIVKKKEGIELNVVLNYEGGYNEIEAKIEKTFAAGGQPTIAVAYPDHVADYKSLETDDKKFVVDLSEYINDPEVGLTKEEEYNPGLNGIDDIVPSFYEEGTQYAEEGVYSFPLMKSTEIMLFNYNIVDMILNDMNIPHKDGVEAYLNSITWNEFIDILKYERENITKYYSNYSSDNIVYPLAYDSDSNLFISQSFQRDISYISMKNNKGSIDFNNEKSKAMVKEFKELYDDNILITKGTNNNKYTSDLFTSNNCTFLVSSTGGTGYNDPSGAFNKVGVCKIPTYSKDESRMKYVSQGVTLTLLNNTKLSDETNKTRIKYAWKLLKYLTSSQVNAELALASEGYIPARYSSYETEDYAAYLEESDFMPRTAKAVINEINGNYFNYPVFKGTANCREQVGGIITQVLLDKKDIDTAFNDAYSLAEIGLM